MAAKTLKFTFRLLAAFFAVALAAVLVIVCLPNHETAGESKPDNGALVWEKYATQKYKNR